MTAPQGSRETFAALFEQTATSNALRRRVHAGDSLEVTIVAVGREAVFADLGGKQEGIFERADLSDAGGNVRVEVGSRVTAVVDAVDPSTGQARLRPVAIRAEGETVATAIPTQAGSRSGGPTVVEGARIKGHVTGVERYGVFVQIAGTHGRSGRGLVPTSETATPRGADLKKHFQVGQEVDAKILSIDETGRIRLSVSALGVDDERNMYEAYKSGQTPAATTGADAAAAKTSGAKAATKPAPRGFGTLGDLLPKVVPAAKPAAPEAVAPVAVTPSNRTRPRRAP